MRVPGTSGHHLAAIAGLYALIVFSGLKGFALWDQVRLLTDEPLLKLFRDLHPHSLRAVVVQPALAMARAGLDPDPLWTLICVVLVGATALLTARAAALLADRPGSAPALRVPALAMWAAVSLAMNGRLIPAFAGLAMVLVVLAERARPGDTHRWTWWPALAVGVLLASVSSGTLAVTAGAAVLAAAAAPGTPRPVIAGLAVAAGAAAIGGAVKALRFFHGDVAAALGHGPGALLLPWGWPALAVAAGTWLATLAWAATAGGRGLVATRLCLPLILAAGLFGWATLSLALLPLLVLTLAWAAGTLPRETPAGT